MKAFIWFMMILIAAVIVTVIKETGYIIGGIPAAILYGAMFFGARKLCQKWDEHKAKKANQNKEENTQAN